MHTLLSGPQKGLWAPLLHYAVETPRPAQAVRSKARTGLLVLFGLQMECSLWQSRHLLLRGPSEEIGKGGSPLAISGLPSCCLQSQSLSKHISSLFPYPAWSEISSFLDIGWNSKVSYRSTAAGLGTLDSERGHSRPWDCWDEHGWGKEQPTPGG